LKKSSAVNKISAIFDNFLKIGTVAVGVQDETLNLIGRWGGLNSVELICLAYCLIFSQNKLLQIASRKTLKSRINDVRAHFAQFSEISEDLRLGLFNFVQSDEVSSKMFFFVSPFF
jgi:hypothetical protein